MVREWTRATIVFGLCCLRGGLTGEGNPPPTAGPTAATTRPVAVADATLTPRRIIESRYATTQVGGDSVMDWLLPPRLSIICELSGDALEGATHVGCLRLDSAKDDHGRPLKLHDPRSARQWCPMGEFGFERNTTKKSIPFEIALELPEKDARSFSVFGVMQIKTDITRPVRVAVRKDDRGRLHAPELDAVGISCEIVDHHEELAGPWVRFGGEKRLARRIEFLDSAGQSLALAPDTSEGTVVGLPEIPASGAIMQIDVLVREEFRSVPFEFKKLPIPQ